MQDERTQLDDEKLNGTNNEQQNHDNLSDNTDTQTVEETTEVTSEEPIQENTENQEEEKSKKKRKPLFGQKNAKEEELKKQLEEEKVKYAELNDRFLRLYSEFDNYKKRTSKEKLDLLATASEKVIVNLLPVVDDFERAMVANEKSEDLAAIKEGFNLIYNKLLQMMKRFDVEEIQAKGEEFNTDFHEAITHFPAQNEEDKGKVMDVTEKGYKIKDKVIRYAKVVVAN